MNKYGGKLFVMTLLVLAIIPFVPFISASGFGYDTPSTTSDVNIFLGNLTLLSQMSDVNIPAPGDDDFLTYDTATSKWISKAVAGLTLWDATFNASFDQRDLINSFNTTYDSFTLNVSRNWSEMVFDEWNAVWSAGGVTIWDATFNASYASEALIIGLNSTYNATYTLYNNTFNQTYDSFTLNVSRNWTEEVFDTWNADWSAGATLWDATFNASYASEALIIGLNSTYNQTYSLYNNTFNQTYDSFTLNVSRNWTEMVFDTWNADWSASGVTIWDTTFNDSFDQRDSDNSYNATYDLFTLNVSRNWTEMTFDEWNSDWISTYNVTYSLYNHTFNQTYDNYALNVSRNWSEMVFDEWNSDWSASGVTIWDTTFNDSFDQRDSDNSYNATYSLYNNTFNQTYDSFTLNVSRNWTEMVFDTWNADWSASGVTIWDATFNASYASEALIIGLNSTYNATYTLYNNTFNQTYDSFTLNVSRNWTEEVFDTWNADWSASGVTIWDTTFNDSFDQRDSDNSYNATYDLFTLNVSRNWSEMTFDEWNSDWLSTYNATYTLYNNTFNQTYDSFTLNVSRNWSQMVFDEWNSDWSSGGNASWNQSFAETLYAPNTTFGIQQLVNNSINSTTWWAGISGWVQGWFKKTGNNLDFNETKLNESIDARTTSTTYYPTSYLTVEGTESGNNDIASLSFYDNEIFNITEEGGGSSILFYVNFTGVTSFEELVMRQQYLGSISHHIEISVYNYDTSSWELEDTISAESSMVIVNIPVSFPTDHVSDEIVQVKFDHIENGNTAHKLLIDFVQLSHGASTLTTVMHDGLSGRDDPINHPWALDKNGSRALTSNWQIGNFNITNVSWLSADYGNFTNVCIGSDCISDWSAVNISSGDLNGTINSIAWNRTGTNVYPNHLGDSVGIGTTSPNTQFEVAQSDNQRFNIQPAEIFANTFNPMVYMREYSPSLGFIDISASAVDFMIYSDADKLHMGTFVQGTSKAEKITLQSDGNVGIGTTSPDYDLEINADSAGKPGAGGLWTVVSDERIKENISDVTGALDIINLLRPVSFNFIEDYRNIHKLKNSAYTGFIAQEYEILFPNAVNIKGDISKVTKEAVIDEEGTIIIPEVKEVIVEDAKDMNTGDLMPYVIKAIQELDEKITRLENK